MSLSGQSNLLSVVQIHPPQPSEYAPPRRPAFRVRGGRFPANPTPPQQCSTSLLRPPRGTSAPHSSGCAVLPWLRTIPIWKGFANSGCLLLQVALLRRFGPRLNLVWTTAIGR